MMQRLKLHGPHEYHFQHSVGAEHLAKLWKREETRAFSLCYASVEPSVHTALWLRKLTIRVNGRLIKESPVAGTEILDLSKIC